MPLLPKLPNGTSGTNVPNRVGSLVYSVKPRSESDAKTADRVRADAKGAIDKGAVSRGLSIRWERDRRKRNAIRYAAGAVLGVSPEYLCAGRERLLRRLETRLALPLRNGAGSGSRVAQTRACQLRRGEDGIAGTVEAGTEMGLRVGCLAQIEPCTCSFE